MDMLELKIYTKKQIHDVLMKLHRFFCFVVPNNNFVQKCEHLRLEVAFRSVQCDNLTTKIYGMKEFKEFIDAVNFKVEWLQAMGDVNNNVANVTNNFNRVNNSIAIREYDQSLLANYFCENQVLSEVLAEDTHEDMIKRSIDILKFLAEQAQLQQKDIDLLWRHALRGSRSFADVTYRVLYDLVNVIPWTLIEHVLTKINDIPLNTYDRLVLTLITEISQRCLNRAKFAHDVPKSVAEHHYGLMFLWRAMQDERTKDEEHIPLATSEIQLEAMNRLVSCLQIDAGLSYQFKKKKRVIRSINAYHLVHICLYAHIYNFIFIFIFIFMCLHDMRMKHTEKITKIYAWIICGAVVQSQIHCGSADVMSGAIGNNVTHISDSTEEKQETETPQLLQRHSTRNEIVGILVRQHRILDFDSPPEQAPSTTEKTANAAPRALVPPPVLHLRKLDNFKARFDFLRFLLQNSHLQLKRQQLEDLWKIVIGDKLDEKHENLSLICKSEHNHFFRWLKEICPTNNKNNNNSMSQAMTVDDAVHLFQTRLSLMPRKTMTSDSLECLHRYFELVHSVSIANAQSTGQIFQIPALSQAIDVMWEIAIEADEDRVAESCGVFVTAFYMKPIPGNDNTPLFNTNALNIFGESFVNDLTRLIQNAGNSANISSNTSNAITSFNDQKTDTNKTAPPIDKWQARHEFVEKCMGYLQQHGMSESPVRYLNRNNNNNNNNNMKALRQIRNSRT
ncbi:ubiquitin domain-containing protein [Reticulomyxa filosa]|uniref:Ubiquitin domain-containing protein n=1 Tax=Reticulomyxa filosa TaxID=46433 RepID=X6MZ62_RETFI|nr:ubiquitin domain-containing protein [Reticulomyxa filosa]|eukprot:ETO19330.1 ubiquitin domain-containing protein [Reticulomyxa filosa]